MSVAAARCKRKIKPCGVVAPLYATGVAEHFSVIGVEFTESFGAFIRVALHKLMWCNACSLA